MRLSSVFVSGFCGSETKMDQMKTGKWADSKYISHLSPFIKDSQGATPFCIMGCVIAVQQHSPEKGAGTQFSSLIQIIFLSSADIFILKASYPSK